MTTSIPKRKWYRMRQKREDFATVSQIIAAWEEMLEKHGDLPVVTSYEGQGFYSPGPRGFQVEEWETLGIVLAGLF